MPPHLSMLPYIVAAWLFFCGLYGIVTSRHLVHTVICLAILQTSTYKLTVDPVVQALMLTDVVVEAVVVALLLAIVVKAYEKSGCIDPKELSTMRG